MTDFHLEIVAKLLRDVSFAIFLVSIIIKLVKINFNPFAKFYSLIVKLFSTFQSLKKHENEYIKPSLNDEVEYFSKAANKYSFASVRPAKSLAVIEYNPIKKSYHCCRYSRA